jgi:hypothetical protein
VINFAIKRHNTRLFIEQCSNGENCELWERCEFKHISYPDNKYKSQIIYLKKTIKDFSHTGLIRKKNLKNSWRAEHVMEV